MPDRPTFDVKMTVITGLNWDEQRVREYALFENDMEDAATAPIAEVVNSILCGTLNSNLEWDKLPMQVDAETKERE